MLRLASRPLLASPRCRRGCETSSSSSCAGPPWARRPPWTRRRGQSGAKPGAGTQRETGRHPPGSSPTCPLGAAGERPKATRMAPSRGGHRRGVRRGSPRRRGRPPRRGCPGRARSPRHPPSRACRGAAAGRATPRSSASGSWPASRGLRPAPSCAPALARSGSSPRPSGPAGPFPPPGRREAKRAQLRRQSRVSCSARSSRRAARESPGQRAALAARVSHRQQGAVPSRAWPVLDRRPPPSARRPPPAHPRRRRQEFGGARSFVFVGARRFLGIWSRRPARASPRRVVQWPEVC
mmetsp:Transcript_78621/g.212835  ORF Transcript_78621/g.212835 Transcript_78621/m.212835 type:complete len:295 (+) Transcript_78621:762-1646(+)